MTLERYIRLGRQCRINLREMLQVIEGGGLLAKANGILLATSGSHSAARMAHAIDF